MPLMKTLEIEKFRCFKKLTVGGLTRVNLVIGPNNSGKTALLEAIEWHASGASPVRLWEGLERRGALVELEGEKQGDRTYDAAELFHARHMDASSPNDLGEMRITDDVGRVSDAKVLAFGNSMSSASLEIVCESGEGRQPALRLAARRGITSQSRQEVRSERGLINRENVYFIAAGPPTAKDFEPLWRSIAATPAEDGVVALLQFVDPRIRKFSVISTSLETSRYSGIVVLLDKSNEREPLSAFGDGMKRSAFLACALARCKGGTLLIDELDDGLHYSVLPKLWRFLAESAQALDVQVFATTHSKDCLEAIAKLHREDAALAGGISIHRLDPGAPKSVDSDASTAAELIAADVELR